MRKRLLVKKVSRRTVLKMAAANAVLGVNARAGIVAGCAEAIPTDRGPFFPRSVIEEAKNLVQLSPGRPVAAGRLIHVGGIIFNQECEPVPGAQVVIWQADAAGLYRHPDAMSQNQLDPNFRYFARTTTNRFGAYRFVTMLPGAYEFSGLKRARHIHFDIRCPEHKNSATEMYFAGEADDERRRIDEVWLSRDPDLRDFLIAAPLSNEQRSVGHPEFPTDDFQAFRFDIRCPDVQIR